MWQMANGKLGIVIRLVFAMKNNKGKTVVGGGERLLLVAHGLDFLYVNDRRTYSKQEGDIITGQTDK